MRWIISNLIDFAPARLWKPGNLRFVWRYAVHFCYDGGGVRTVEVDGREVLMGSRMRMPLDHREGPRH